MPLMRFSCSLQKSRFSPGLGKMVLHSLGQMHTEICASCWTSAPPGFLHFHGCKLAQSGVGLGVAAFIRVLIGVCHDNLSNPHIVKCNISVRYIPSITASSRCSLDPSCTPVLILLTMLPIHASNL